MGAPAVGALPDLVTCCAGLAVGSECVCLTVAQTSAPGKQPVGGEPTLSSALQGRKQETPSLETADRLQLSPPYSASPHTSSSGSSSSEEEGSGSSSPALDLSPSRGPEAANSPCSSGPQEEKEEEDVLKYVREIFFS